MDAGRHWPVLGRAGGGGPHDGQPLRRDRQRYLPQRRTRRAVRRGRGLAGVHAPAPAARDQPERRHGGRRARASSPRRPSARPPPTSARCSPRATRRWITSQMALPETSHRAATDADAAAFPPTGQYPVTQDNRQAAWWKISVDGPRPAAPAGRVRPERDLRDLGRRLAACEPARRAREVLRHARERRLRQLPAAAPGRDPEPRDGQLPEHAAQRQGQPRQGDERRRELRPGGAAALHHRPERAPARRDAHARLERAADPHLRPGRDRPDRQRLHRLGLPFHGRQPELLRDRSRLRRPDDVVSGVP